MAVEQTAHANDRWKPIDNDNGPEIIKSNTKTNGVTNDIAENEEAPKSLTSPKAFQDKDKPKITITFNQKTNGKLISCSSSSDHDKDKPTKTQKDKESKSFVIMLLFC